MASASPRWYHPNLTHQDAERLLMERSHPDGSYLVRPCETHRGSYVLVVKAGEKVFSIRIENSGDFFQLEASSCAQAQGAADGSRVFPTLAELISHCVGLKELTLPEDESGTSCSVTLRAAVPCLDLSSKRWYHGQLDTEEACRKLSAVEQQNVFLVRCRTADPGSFSIMVTGKNGIHHIAVIQDSATGDYSCDGVRFSSSLVALVERHSESAIRIACDSGIGEESVFLKKPYFYTAFVISNAITHIEDMLTSRYGKALSSEFEHLEDCNNLKTFSFAVGKREENNSRNRYRNILPYDHNRVALQDQLDGVTRPSGSNDYINASYINARAIGLPNSYIVTQGCRNNTMDDFWWMVWQENVPLIIMVTEVEEAGKKKCATYWPSAGSKTSFGCVQVMSVKETGMTNYILREFQLSLKRSRGFKRSVKDRTVYQVQFRGWPDHGVPQESLSVLHFVEEAKALLKKQADSGFNGSTIVHCSAGIGRSGVIVVLDILLDLISKTDPSYEIDIQQVIHLIRDQRCGMVQTYSQYVFIHHVLLEYLRKKAPTR